MGAERGRQSQPKVAGEDKNLGPPEGGGKPWRVWGFHNFPWRGRQWDRGKLGRREVEGLEEGDGEKRSDLGSVQRKLRRLRDLRAVGREVMVVRAAWRDLPHPLGNKHIRPGDSVPQKCLIHACTHTDVTCSQTHRDARTTHGHTLALL